MRTRHETPFAPIRGEAGLALASALVLIIVLGLLGSGVYWTTHSDIVRSGRDLRRVRSDFAAESAVQWALLELSRTDGGRTPFTLATHDSSGNSPLPAMVGGKRNKAVFDPSLLSAYPGRRVEMDPDGWVVSQGFGQQRTFSSGKDELLAFKVWYPDHRTLRISGRGEVEGKSSTMDVLSRLDTAWIPL